MTDWSIPELITRIPTSCWGSPASHACVKFDTAKAVLAPMPVCKTLGYDIGILVANKVAEYLIYKQFRAIKRPIKMCEYVLTKGVSINISKTGFSIDF